MSNLSAGTKILGLQSNSPVVQTHGVKERASLHKDSGVKFAYLSFNFNCLLSTSCGHSSRTFVSL